MTCIKYTFVHIIGRYATWQKENIVSAHCTYANNGTLSTLSTEAQGYYLRIVIEVHLDGKTSYRGKPSPTALRATMCLKNLIRS